MPLREKPARICRRVAAGDDQPKSAGPVCLDSSLSTHKAELNGEANLCCTGTVPKDNSVFNMRGVLKVELQPVLRLLNLLEQLRYLGITPSDLHSGVTVRLADRPARSGAFRSENPPYSRPARPTGCSGRRAMPATRSVSAPVRPGLALPHGSPAIDNWESVAPGGGRGGSRCCR